MSLDYEFCDYQVKLAYSNYLTWSFTLMLSVPPSYSYSHGNKDWNECCGAKPRDCICSWPDSWWRPSSGDDHILWTRNEKWCWRITDDCCYQGPQGLYLECIVVVRIACSKNSKLCIQRKMLIFLNTYLKLNMIRLGFFFKLITFVVGCCLSILKTKEEKQCDYSASAMSGVLRKYSVSNLPSGYGGHHQCSLT